MKHIYVRIVFILISVLLTSGTKAYNDGLYFNSHSYATEKRTTLRLNDGAPINFKGTMVMTFSMDLRERPFFGNIFCIKTDDGRHIDAILSIQDRDKYKPALVVDGKLHQIDYNVTGAQDIPVSITLDKNSGNITLSYAGHRITAKTDLSKSSETTVIFGMHPYEQNLSDVAPMNVRDIKVSYDGKDKYFWELRQHDGRVCTDNISGTKAVATNGQWLADNHVIWKNRLTYKSKDKLQITFNPDENIFYIVENKTVKCYDPVSGAMKTVKVNGGHRAMMYSNYINYSPKDKSLYTYNLQKGLISRFDFATGQWSNREDITDEPAYSNHSVAMAGDSALYAFGGYGFYRYNNSLFRIIPADGRIEELDYQPKLTPRTWSASAIVGNKLYIFGGYGNATGEQEQPGVYYYDMSRIDLKTMKMEKLWTMEGNQNTSFQLSSEMLYNEADSTFYAAVTNSSGRLIKIWMNEPKWKIVTGVTGGKLGYKELTFNIYKSTKENKIYAVIDRLQNDRTHEVAICSIDLPVMDDYAMPQKKKESNGNLSWLYLLLIIPIAPAAYAAFRIIKGRNSRIGDSTRLHGEEKQARIKDNGAGAAEDAAEETLQTETDGENIQEETVKYYTPAASSIQMLGKFVVKDKDGNDITSQFTKRTRNLMLMLLLHSEASKKGIEIHQLDETLWQEMDDESARNNRNVYMRKLRVLLEKVGDVEIVNDKIYYRVNIGGSVFFDYHEAMALMNSMECGDTDVETTARMLELLFEGPLLPNYSFEWLDKFKSDYSNTAISLLTRRLNREMQGGNDSMALKIAKTILMHDPFSDKALAAQCSILCRRHKKGIAKNVYDNFCKNYETCIGEKYHISFAEVCK